ncbi:hypothetical protein F5887DRAFT_1068808 [Amanita rubescens]|nr:hypothetical protein F5887DRAFT_1068808 [Amanita rubescens]
MVSLCYLDPSSCDFLAPSNSRRAIVLSHQATGNGSRAQPQFSPHDGTSAHPRYSFHGPSDPTWSSRTIASLPTVFSRTSALPLSRSFLVPLCPRPAPALSRPHPVTAFIIAYGAVGTPQILSKSGINPPALGRYLSEQSITYCRVIGLIIGRVNIRIRPQIVLKRSIINSANCYPQFEERIKEHRKAHPDDVILIPFDELEPQVCIPYHPDQNSEKDFPWHVQIHRDAFSYGEVKPTVDPRIIVDLRFFGKSDINKANRVEFPLLFSGYNPEWAAGDTDLYGMPQATFCVTRSKVDIERDERMMEDTKAVAQTLGEYLGPDAEPQFMPALHITGTTRMQPMDATAPEKIKKVSVDKDSKVHDYENLWLGFLSLHHFSVTESNLEDFLAAVERTGARRQDVHRSTFKVTTSSKHALSSSLTPSEYFMTLLRPIPDIFNQLHSPKCLKTLLKCIYVDFGHSICGATFTVEEFKFWGQPAPIVLPLSDDLFHSSGQVASRYRHFSPPTRDHPEPTVERISTTQPSLALRVLTTAYVLNAIPAGRFIDVPSPDMEIDEDVVLPEGPPQDPHQPLIGDEEVFATHRRHFDFDLATLVRDRARALQFFHTLTAKTNEVGQIIPDIRHIYPFDASEISSDTAAHLKAIQRESPLNLEIGCFALLPLGVEPRDNDYFIKHSVPHSQLAAMTTPTERPTSIFELIVSVEIIPHKLIVTPVSRPNQITARTIFAPSLKINHPQSRAFETPQIEVKIIPHIWRPNDDLSPGFTNQLQC